MGDYNIISGALTAPKWQPRSMCLDSINIHDAQRARRDAPVDPLAVSDIAGATVPRAAGSTNRPDLSGTRDIKGASPRPQHQKLRNKPYFLGDNRDIEGSQPTLGAPASAPAPAPAAPRGSAPSPPRLPSAGPPPPAAPRRRPCPGSPRRRARG